MIAISATGSADVNTERFGELASALGADLGTPEMVEAKATYEAALAEFQAVAAEKKDLTVLFMYIAPEEIYAAYPPDWADLAMYQRLGLTIVEPEAEPGTFWEQLSPEQILKYPADIILNSTRPGNMTIDELKEHPTYSLHPEIKAGQVGPWNQDFIMSCQGMTAALNSVISPVRDANKVT